MSSLALSLSLWVLGPVYVEGRVIMDKGGHLSPWLFFFCLSLGWAGLAWLLCLNWGMGVLIFWEFFCRWGGIMDGVGGWKIGGLYLFCLLWHG